MKFYWFYFLIIMECLLVMLIASMIFFSPFLDVMRMSIMSTISTSSYLAQLESGTLCLDNTYFWIIIYLKGIKFWILGVLNFANLSLIYISGVWGFARR